MATELELIKASEIDPKDVEWLWYPFIPYGKVTLIQGYPGDGKSIFILSIASLLTQGKKLPFCDEEIEACNVIYQTTEDDAEDTIVPRFIKSGGDRNRLLFINENKKTLAFNDERILQAIKLTNAKLLILDPLSSYIGENTNMNLANECRTQFNHLINVAKETNCAIVIIGHLNKAQGMKAINRTNGSMDIVGAVRSALIITKLDEKNRPNDRILVMQKSNLAPTGKAIIFSIVDGKIEWLEEIEKTADEILDFTETIGRPDIQTQKAIETLKELLEDKTVLQKEIMEKMSSVGISERTTRKAKAMLEVESVKKGNQWFWYLKQ